MSEPTPFIDALVKDYNEAQDVLLEKNLTAAQGISAHLTKILVLTCTSYYEYFLQKAYSSYAIGESDSYGDKPHRFDIDKNDKSVYNRFSFGRLENPDDLNNLPDTKRLLEPLAFFGKKFKEKVFNEVSADAVKEAQLKAFQEMFAIRNLIAHQTYVPLNNNVIREKSFMDIKQMHEKAIEFVFYLCEKFR